MSDLIQQFQFDNSQIRIIEKDGEPWFIAYDVANTLGYVKPNNAVNQHCKKILTTPFQGSGNINIIPESDVYRLIMRSKLPSAEKFEEWVTGEVLPSIGKKGYYGKDPMELLNSPEAMRGLLLTYSEKVLALESKVEADAPKVKFYDNVANIDGLYNLQNAARALGKQPNLFIRWLKEKYLFYQGQALVPYIQFRQQGLFDVKVTIVDDKQRPQTFITPKGLRVFGEETGDLFAIA